MVVVGGYVVYFATTKRVAEPKLFRMEKKAIVA